MAPRKRPMNTSPWLHAATPRIRLTVSTTPATAAGSTPARTGASAVQRSELAAGAVDLAASGVADGGRHALGLEPADELALVLPSRGGPLRARRRVERDQVDVHPAPVAVRRQHVA